MTQIFGNSGDGGTTGIDGSRVVVTYSYTQNVAGNYTDVAWSYGVDYGDPNWWTNISNRSVAWSVNVGASISGVAGSGTGTSSSGTINTSDPGYGGQIHYFWSGTARIVHNSSGQGTIHLAASMNLHSSAYTSSISTNIALPDIVQAPTAPGGANASRVNDGQINVAWANNSSSHHEYASQSVQRSVDGGAYATIASGLAAAATTYSDTGASANHKYSYKAVATNAAGTAVGSAGTPAYTTPGTPTGLTATKLGTGNIRLDWSGHVGYGDTAYSTRIEESQNGGAYSEITSVAGGVATYEHASPSTSVTHTYRVRHRSTTGSLNGSYSTVSNTVTLLATAGAPTGLAPSGAAQDAAGNIVLSWTHNPTDGTPQSKRHVQVKVNAGAYADVVNDSSATSSYTITAGTWTNGDTITWKVATAGQNGTLGAYSAEASFTLSAKPTATIATPSGTYDTSSLTVTWGYFQAQSSAQAAWQASLYDDASVLLATISGTTETAGTFAAPVADGATYTVTVTVTSAAGLTSTADSETFTVAYLPPAAISIAGVFDDAAGFTVLTLTGEGAVTDVTEPITTVDVQRQINGGEWVTILTGVVLDLVSLTAVVQDTVPITVGSNNYRAIAHSALPSSVMSAEDEVVTSEMTWGYLGGGDSFGTVARFRATPSYAASTSRAKALYHFAGRPKPVQLAGEAVTSTLAVSGRLSSGSGTAADFEALGLAEGVVCWRGPDGRRLFASLDKVALGVTRLHALTTVAFGLTEVDFTEGDQ